MKECYNSRPARSYQEKRTRIRRYLQRVVPPFHEYTNQYLKGVLSRVTPLVDKKMDWIPQNDFDTEFGIFAEVSGMVPQLSERARALGSGDKSQPRAFVKTFAKRMELKPGDSDALIVIKHTFFRWCFNFLCTNGPPFSGDPAMVDGFFENCTIVASHSARALGIPDHLLTPQQMDPSFLALAKSTPSIRVISRELNSVQFYNAPSDALALLQNIFPQLDELARTSKLERALGQYARLVNGGPKKMAFMSFDDCFSLFFAILAVDPPRNAIWLCEIFQKLPDLSTAATAKYAVATFVAAVEHICGFSGDQLVQTESDSIDPLGIKA
jgi:hypothetical protein